MNQQALKTDTVNELNNKPTRVVIVPPKSNIHKNTIIWIHGLNENPEKYLHLFKNKIFDNFKVIAPEAPKRFVTIKDQIVSSWFDIKFRSQKSFIVPFDQAFSSAQVIDSFQRVLKPLINSAKQQLDKVNQDGKLIIAGFSQGCGMSLHSFYSINDKVDAVIGLCGYLFPITPFSKTNKYVRIIHGANDPLRPFEYVKATYENKIQQNKITIVQKTGHQINQQVAKQFRHLIQQYLSS